jgi:hypothetical protein
MSDAWVQTFNRNRFDLLEPREEDVDLADIVRALCKLNRFTGHTETPYTVAEHAILAGVECWMRARRDGKSDEEARDIALCGLHHDDAEAYLGDVSAPLKRALGEKCRALFKSVEAVVDEAILMPLLDKPKAARVIRDLFVRPVDMSLLAWEADAFLPGGRRPDWPEIHGATPLICNPAAILKAMPENRRFAFYSLHEALVKGEPLPLWTGVGR